MPINVKDKMAGLLVPVFALRRADDLGIGDTQSIKDAVDFCRDMGMAVLQILPINETGGDNSPYNAISSVALDPAFLTMTVDQIPGLTDAIISAYATPNLLQRLREGSIDYATVKRLKWQILDAAFEAFERESIAVSDDAGREFRAFELDHVSWLPSYTLFRTLVNEHDGNAVWTSWPAELQDPDGALRWLDKSPRNKELARFRRLSAFVQWVAFRQWKEVKAYADRNNVQLMGDVPFGVSRYSADVWAFRELFDLDWSGGAPPETYFQGDPFVQKWGQNWGIPIYDWEANRKQNFSWWRQRVQRVGDFFHYFRIDHVLGFFRVYAFPWMPERNDEFVKLTEKEAAKLTGGKLPQFLPGPDEPAKLALVNKAQGEEILKVILEAAGDMGVVAEDLGVVPNYVRPLLKELGIPGFYIPIFERNEVDRSFKPVEEIPELTLATYATHDHEPIVRFYQQLVEKWLGPDGHQSWLEVQRLMQFLDLDENDPPKEFTPELHKAFFERLLESQAWLAIFMITDLLGTSQRFNEPGSSTDSNWSQRLDREIGEYARDPQFGIALKSCADLIKANKRVPLSKLAKQSS
jgi:4-alpha-glucanotransferase